MNRLTQGERGQITTALVIVGTVIVVALGVLATKLGQATDQKSQVQIAADAAALAGAQQIRNDAPGLIIAAIRSGGGAGLGCGLGEVGASDFANRNGASVVEYCYTPGTDTIRVKVNSLTNSASGSPAEARADAQVGLTLGDCVLPPPPAPPTVPPTTMPPTPAPGSPPTTAPPVPGEASCGDLVIPIMFDGSTGVITVDLTEAKILDMFTPALKR